MNASSKCIALCCALLLSACEETVLHDLQEREAIKAVFDLQSQGISATKERSAAGWSIAVKREDLLVATAALREHGTLREDQKKETSRSILWSRADRLHQREIEITSKLEETFEALPGVLDARLNLYLNDARALTSSKLSSTSSASAVLIVTDSFAVEAEDLNRIMRGATAIPASAIEIVLVADTRFSAERTKSAPVKARPHAFPALGKAKTLLLLMSAGCTFLLGVFVLRLRRARRRRRLAFAQKMQDGTAAHRPQVAATGSQTEFVQ